LANKELVVHPKKQESPLVTESAESLLRLDMQAIYKRARCPQPIGLTESSGEEIIMMKKETYAKKGAMKKGGTKKTVAKKGTGMTAAQKKLPPFIQKAIMNKKKSK
jgi:hypothetical protein